MNAESEPNVCIEMMPRGQALVVPMLKGCYADAAIR
jgi:hypothetical protein